MEEKKFLIIGAHPDDADLMFGGCAVKFIRKGSTVKFVSATNGDAGHYSETRESLAERRLKETQEVVARSGIESYQVLDIHDCELSPSLENRRKITTIIREFKPDIVISHRIYDYHADHRAAAQLVQDSAYLVMVPLFCPDIPVPEKEPIYLFSYDSFKKPCPFEPHVIVSIDDVISEKLSMMDSHTSQFYEWLPYVDGKINEVPEAGEDRLKWLADNRLTRNIDQAGSAMKYAETFELSEYGRQPDEGELEKIFNSF